MPNSMTGTILEVKTTAVLCKVKYNIKAIKNAVQAWTWLNVMPWKQVVKKGRNDL